MSAVLAVLRPRAAVATTDAYSDLPVPPAAAAAEQALRALKPARRRREAGIGVELDLTLDEHWDLLRAYAAWSINADLFDEHWQPVGTFTDTGATILARLHDDEGADVAAVLRDIVPFVPLTLVDERLRRKRAEAKTQRRAQRAARRELRAVESSGACGR